ncbi:MAG: sulfotransferase family 2 domain-containing protein [Pseudomonadales bacterium]|nr:sulfotransferase family 2 domain-containing protein [Halieaceae bacterium]MCP5164125.1 sulfotransferase family 2 domain-containing protein [Pseudomonadales bacterium]MCP5190497.1 sulfotransferase family 2 domain-containing protein [Pseudomonadales bacterium]MCP5203799.1 sulfotransferase family 2 domain-containing protein [Pseudomonadales bacterium]
MTPLGAAIAGWRRRYRTARKKPDVWVLDEPGVAFIQIRKVASRSARLAFSQYLLGQALAPDSAAIDRIDRQYARHLSTRRIARLARSHYVFTIVRNPLARLHSCYAHKIVAHREQGLANPFSTWGIHADMSFAEFVARVAEIPDRDSNTHFRSMHPFLTHGGKLLPHTVCRLESLARDWQEVQRRIPGFPDLPRINRTDHSDRPAYLDAYDYRSAQLACRRYRQDIELLGYGEAAGQLLASLR